MAHVANLVRWEWFKLRRRWMPWILLAILVLISQMAVWGTFFGYRDQQRSGGTVFFGAGASDREPVEIRCNDLLARRTSELPPDTDPRFIEHLIQQCQERSAQNQEELQHLRGGFTLPSSIALSLLLIQGFGLILTAILASSAVATEYSWGTLRTVLIKGAGRWPLLTAKLILTALLVAGALVVISLAVALSSQIAQGFVSGEAPVKLPIQWGDVAVAFGKSWFAFLPYVALVTFIAVLTGSPAAGTAAALGYYFAEQIVVAILINVFDWFETVADYLLVRNIAAWILADAPFTDPAFFLSFGGTGFPGELHAFLVLTAYSLALGGLAFWVFHRQDVAGGGGG